MAKEAFYFSHDYNARSDDKILELRANYGAEGYGIYWMIVETMAENAACKLDINLIAGLSLSYGISKDKLIKIINFCISIHLFIEDNNFIFSKRLNAHKDFRHGKSEDGKKGAQKKWETVREKKAEFRVMAEFFHNTCVRCEGASNLANVERDHIIPSYQGGIDDVTNYQPLCARCNASKGPETIDHRISYAKKYGLTIPDKWLSYPVAIAKERKGKENKGKEKKEEGNKFSIPSQEEVYDLMFEKLNDQKKAMTESLKFINHYSSNGWKVGKNKMQSWPAAVAGWITRMGGYEKGKEKISKAEQNMINGNEAVTNLEFKYQNENG